MRSLMFLTMARSSALSVCLYRLARMEMDFSIFSLVVSHNAEANSVLLKKASAA